MSVKKILKKHIGNIFSRLIKRDFQDTSSFRILLYHSITDQMVKSDTGEETTPKALFEEQMRYLKNNKFNLISIKDALNTLFGKGRLQPRSICISFDDGFKDNFSNAFEILKKFGIPATLFITLNFIEEHSRDPRFLNKQELAVMKDSGLIDIGLHGKSHHALSRLPKEQLNEEVVTAKKELSSIINGEISLIAYPFGHRRSYNREVIQLAKRAGFIGGLSAAYGRNSRKTDPFSLRRNRISWIDDIREFEKHLYGAYDWYAFYQSCAPKRFDFKYLE